MSEEYGMLGGSNFGVGGGVGGSDVGGAAETSACLAVVVVK